ncbi:MAG: hypothetical protein EBS01_02300 [Verrucomicrobia bacterium]|nr:hypothetical protein [Verrucomicrobiota bacterium]
MLQSGETLDGYRLIRPIGAGGFGEVWLCQSDAVGDFRALKFIPATSTGHLEKEFDSICKYRAAATQLRSPSIMPIEHVNRRGDGLFYIMPLSDGYGVQDPTHPEWYPLTMAAIIEGRRGEATWFSSEEIRNLITPILQALQLLSDAGLVHRDVKPENLLFVNSFPCLGDISLLGNDSSNLTQRGTPGYSAPSWFVESGGHPDMYGAAMTLYAILTGNPPDKMGRAAFRWPPHGENSLSATEREAWLAMHRVIARAVEDRPEERFSRFEQFAAVLKSRHQKLEDFCNEAVAEGPQEKVHQEIKRLQTELETIRNELEELRGSFRSFVETTVSELDAFTEANQTYPQEAAALLETVAEQFVERLRSIPSMRFWDEKVRLASGVRQMVQAIRETHGPAICSGLDKLHEGLATLFSSERGFRAEQMGKVIAKAVSIQQAGKLAKVSVFKMLESNILGAILGTPRGIVCGATAPTDLSDNESGQSALASVSKIVESAQRFLNDQSV